MSGIWQNDGDDAPNDVFQTIDKAAQKHTERFAHLDASMIIPHPVIALLGSGGTGKTDFLLRDECLQRKCYIAQSHKLSRAKAAEYKLAFSEECDFESITQEIKDIDRGKKQHLIVRNHNRLELTVWARAQHESELIWGVIHRYANVLIFDEVSMMHNETVAFLMERFKQHKIFLCGDPGFQLAAYSTNADSGTPKTPFNAAKLNIPTYTFTKIFRVKCDRLLQIRQEGRKMLERGTTTLTWEQYRERHAGVQFPDDWGIQQYKKPGPVAGLCFADVDQWYIEKVALQCNSQSGLMHKFRRFVDKEFHQSQPITVEELEEFYKARFITVSSFQEVADNYQAWEFVDGKYLPKDMIICSTNAYADEWTEFLTPLQPFAKVTTTTEMKQGNLFKYFENAPSERAHIELKLNLAYARYLNAPAGSTQQQNAYRQYKHYDELHKAVQPPPKKASLKRKTIHDELPDTRPAVSAKEMQHLVEDAFGEWQWQSFDTPLFHKQVDETTLVQTKLIEGPVPHAVDISSSTVGAEDLLQHLVNDQPDHPDYWLYKQYYDEWKINSYTRFLNAADYQADSLEKRNAYNQYTEFKTLLNDLRKSAKEDERILIQQQVWAAHKTLMHLLDGVFCQSFDTPFLQWLKERPYYPQDIFTELKMIEGPVPHAVDISSSTVPENHVVTANDVQLQKWKIESTTRDYSKGEIVISADPPTEKCHIAHAFTAHSTIGETARGKVFIDRRNLFEVEHWETIIGRARRWEDIIIVDLPDPDPSEKWANTIIYIIWSKKGNCCYIGFTTQTLEKRKQRHADAFKAKKKECAASQVLKYRDWQMDIVEEFPCANRAQAEARENYHIQRADNCVNKSIRHGAKLDQCAPKQTALKMQVISNTRSEAALAIEQEIDANRILAQKRAEIEERLRDEAEGADERIRYRLEEIAMQRIQIEFRLREEAEREDEAIRKRTRKDSPPLFMPTKKPRGMVVSMEQLRKLRDM